MMASESNPELAAGLARVQPALAAWRKQRKHREPIPEALWRAMVPLARAYGVSPVAQALRVNYTALKRHVTATAPLGESPPGFVEVPLATGWVGPQCVIELEDRSGAQLTLRLAQGGSAEALALAQGLWRERV